MAYLNLDKTYTLRQILWRTVLVLAVLSVLYFCLLVRRDWNVTMGGVGYGNSPYKDVVPKECLSWSWGHSGGDAYSSLTRRGLRAFQHRTFLRPIDSYIDHINCSGYGILIGLHGDYYASYSIIYTGVVGERLAIETVEYHTERQVEGYIRPR
jgi:hypothetical protein